MSGDAAQSGYTGRSVGGGRYLLRGLLGEGGMASVHLAHDTVLDRPVAVKTLHTDLGAEQSFRERFRREAQSVAKLNHPNIVSVFDSGEDHLDGRPVPYIVMEYVEGRPLGDVLAADITRYGAMPADRALEITGDVLAALAASHETGLVHRDIKPGNVMVTRRGVVKVMDFGIARAMQSGVTSMTQTGVVVGTPQYLSPEQALGRGLDERSDLYSVGCLLFELLTGRTPFDADSALGMAYQHVREAPPAPSAVNRALGPAVDALVGRALRKNPAERFPTADAMHDEVDRLLAATRSGAAPMAAGDVPVTSQGEGAAAAVPPAATPAPAPPPLPTPYAPTPPQQGFGPTTPPPSAYGYPVPHTPPHAPAYPVPHTPVPPQAPWPSGPEGPGGGRSSTPLILAAVAAVAVVALIAMLVVAKSGDGGPVADPANSPPPSASPTSSASSAPSRRPASAPARPTATGTVVPGDQTRTIETRECTDAHNDLINPGRPDIMTMPNFRTIYVDSVVACMKAAGWRYTIKPMDEQLWGKGAVTAQSPADEDDYDPRTNGPVTIWVSTGRSAG